ncbi:hypothetical protein HF1_05170 [Mycoplasma haemofelis str. Langford 1]|uniref:Uncharacterized protein n=1 Tax=Mycoplasma haemofelis (strain Langford 1) TaxID=941640 RepID=E8ZHA4_MYCHL|nr:hypothetical protein HF1_05170 [Mycoplasma haemofelis str. Langford 1]
MSGNRYGTVDKGMTKEDLESAKKLRDNLKELHGKLLSMEKN